MTVERISLDGACWLLASTLLFGCANSSSPTEQADGDPRAAPAVATSAAASTATASGTAKEDAKWPLAKLEGLQPALSKTLAAQAVHQGNWFAQRELYTWMPAQQRKALVGYRHLVSRRGSPKAMAVFDWRLGQQFKAPAQSTGRPSKESPRYLKRLITLLSRGPLKFRRFAWSNAWATSRGLAGKAYGDKVVKVTLKEQAWIARLDSRIPGGWQVASLTGEAVSFEQLSKEPSRLAAIYHVWHGANEAAAEQLPSATVPFREFVLCNESMLLKFEADTPDVVARIQRDQRFLEGLAVHLAGHPSAVRPAASERLRLVDELLWSAAVEQVKPGFFGSALAAATEPYQLRVEQLRAIVAALVASLDDPGEPLLQLVTARFGGPLPRRITKPMARPQRCLDPSMMGPGCR